MDKKYVVVESKDGRKWLESDVYIFGTTLGEDSSKIDAEYYGWVAFNPKLHGMEFFNTFFRALTDNKTFAFDDGNINNEEWHIASDNFSLQCAYGLMAGLNAKTIAQYMIDVNNMPISKWFS